MKRSLLGYLIIAMVSIALFVSCNAETVVPGEDVAYVRFDGTERDLSVKYETKDYNDLYWFYTATKADGYGTSGQTTTETLVKTVDSTEKTTDSSDYFKGFSQAVGPFSQGKWTFTLTAYSALSTKKSNNNYTTDTSSRTVTLDSSFTATPSETAKVYESGAFTVVLSGGETKSVAVSVKPASSVGYLAFENATFDYAEVQSQTDSSITKTSPLVKIKATRTTKGTDGNTPTYVLTNEENYSESGATVKKIKLTSTDSQKYTIAFDNGDLTSLEMQEGTYKCVASAYIKGGESKPLVSQTFYFAIYGKATTKITGSLIEEVTSKVNFDVKKQSIETKLVTTEKVTESGSGTGTGTSTTRIKNSVELKYKAPVSPATSGTSTTDVTTVTFPAKAITVSEKETTDVVDLSLSVTVTEAAAGDNSFQLSDSKKENLYGSIDLKLTKIVNGVEAGNITTFDSEVTVSAYIGEISNGSGGTITATDIRIVYTGEDGKGTESITVESYSDGVVTFKTKHFSNFAIINKNSFPAVKVTSGSNNVSYYASLDEAVEKAEDGSRITLQLPASLSADVSTSKKLTLDLNDQLLTFESCRIALLDGAEITVANEYIATGESSGGTNSQKAGFIDGVFTASESSKVDGTYKPALFGINNDTTGKYSSLGDAISKVAENGTITLLQDATLREDVSVGKKITIALGANTLTAYSNKVKVEKDGVVTVTGKVVPGFVNGVEVCIKEKENYKYYPTLEAAAKDGNNNFKLLDNVTVTEAVTFKKTTTIDLNGKTLDFAVATSAEDEAENKNLGAFELEDGSNAYTVTFKNGKITGTRTGIKTNVFTLHKNTTLVLDGINMDVTATRGIQIYQNTNPATVKIKNNSTITVTGDYALSTEATVKDGKTSANIKIEITNSTLKTANDSQDNTALLVNVPSSVTIEDSTISGQRQGAVLRGGSYVIKNSAFESTGTTTSYSDWTNTESNDWGIGNQVPLAALVIGNRNSGSYKYPTSVSLENVTLRTGESTVRKDIYVYQQSDYTVTVRGADASWSKNDTDKMGGASYSVTEAKIGNVSYSTLEEAVKSAKSGKTITLQADIDLTSYKSAGDDPGYTFSFEKDVTVDLNGKTVKSNNFGVVFEGDGLILKNGTFESADGGSYALFIGNGAVYPDGSLYNVTVEDVVCRGGINVYRCELIVNSMTCTEVSGTLYYALWVEGAGRIIVNDGNFASESSSAGIVLRTNGNSEIVINGGTFGAKENQSLFTGYISVNKGSFSGKLVPDKITLNGLTITGGEFTTDPSGYVPCGYKITEDSGKYTVEEGQDTVSTWDGTSSDTSWYQEENNKSKYSEYTLTNASQLAGLASLVNNGKTFGGVTIRLGCCVDLASHGWEIIGNGSRNSKTYTGNAFEGTFDGNGHTISNLKITSTSDADKNKCLGLFGVLDGGTVENLVLTNVSVSATKCENVGAVVGLALNGSVIADVKVESGSVTAVGSVGGIVGRMIISGTIWSCENDANVTSDVGVGGIVGKAYYSENEKEINIIDCKNTGTITATSSGYVGGIAGLLAGNAIECTNEGTITGTTNGIGGIVGELNAYGSVVDCVNTKDVTSTGSANCVGGIVGWVRYENMSSYPKYEIIKITGNTNSGSISGNYSSGGIIGMIYDAAVVTGNTSTASTIKGGNFAGGIAGAFQAIGGSQYQTDGYQSTSVSYNTSTTPIGSISASCNDLIVYDNKGITITGNQPADHKQST